jgi:hypothetical protein
MFGRDVLGLLWKKVHSFVVHEAVGVYVAVVIPNIVSWLFLGDLGLV